MLKVVHLAAFYKSGGINHFLNSGIYTVFYFLVLTFQVNHLYWFHASF